jgi:TolB-like protein
MTSNPSGFQRFFAEMKRRRVFNSAALYGGVAFVVFQAADFVVPALHLPESVSTAIVLVSVIGFPFAMVTAWFFDITSGGIRRTAPPRMGEIEAIVDQPALKRWPFGIAAILGVALLLGTVAWHFKDPEEGGLPSLSGEIPTMNSVAVLPFLNMLNDGEEAYLAEGINEELREGLRRVPGLRVTGRTSTLSVEHDGEGAKAIEEELNVGWFVEGSVGEAGDQVGLAVRLVSVADRERGWTKSYQLPKKGFLAALDSVAWDLAGQLGAQAPGGERGPLVRSSTVDFTAYSDYLRGRSLSNQKTPGAIQSAIGYYNRALLLDPDFGKAWSALAMAYVLLPEAGGPPMAELLPYAQAALKKAVEPGREMPDGFAASGYLKWVYLWDLPGADEDFRRAIELDPENSVSRYWYAQYLTTERRWEDAWAQVEKALELDPRSAAAYLTKGLILFCARREGADEAFRRALELAPDMHPAAYVLAGSLAREGDLGAARRAFDQFSSLTGTDPAVFQGYLAALSDPARAGDAVAAFQDAGFYGPVQGAELLAHLGENDAALDLLERAARDRSPYLPWVNAMPGFDGLRADPRFQGVLAWVGF